MAQFDQAALTEMFRQSFSPIANYGAGQLAIVQEQQARQYAAQLQAAQRAQMLRDNLQLMQANDRMLTQRQTGLEKLRAQSQLEQEQARGQAETLRALAAAGLASKENRRSAELARQAAEHERARVMAANLGIDDVDPKDPDFVTTVTQKAAAAVKKHRGSATQIAKDLSDLDKQISVLANDVDIPEARAVQLAKPLLLSLATDPKRAAKYRGLSSIDDILAAAADEGATDKIQQALNREQVLRNSTFERKVRPLQSRQIALQKTMSVLEAKGISPDYEALMPPPNDGAAAQGSEAPDGEGLGRKLLGAAPALTASEAAPEPRGGRNPFSVLGAVEAMPAIIPAAAADGGRAVDAASRGAINAGRHGLGWLRGLITGDYSPVGSAPEPIPSQSLASQLRAMQLAANLGLTQQMADEVNRRR